MRKHLPRRSTPISPGVAVEYPQEGELITDPRYTFRIGGPAQCVEIAIDGDDWQPCRQSDDFWWFDWSGYDSGRHQAVVRAADPGGLDQVHVCRFQVSL